MNVIYPEVTQGIVNRVTTSYFRYQGWPSVARDENGTLYAVASSFRTHHKGIGGRKAPPWNRAYRIPLDEKRKSRRGVPYVAKSRPHRTFQDSLLLGDNLLYRCVRGW